MSADEQPVTVARAEQGAEAWHDVARLQQATEPDHSSFYALAGEIVPTLYSLQDLANVLRRQVAGYGEGRSLYDDAGREPAVRLAEAVEHLALLRDALGAAQRHANDYWSAIGHVGVDR